MKKNGWTAELVELTGVCVQPASKPSKIATHGKIRNIGPLK